MLAYRRQSDGNCEGVPLTRIDVLSSAQEHLIHRKPLRFEFQQSVYRPLRPRYYLYFKTLNNEHLSTCNSIVGRQLTNGRPDVSFHTCVRRTACSGSPFTRVLENAFVRVTSAFAQEQKKPTVVLLPLVARE